MIRIISSLLGVILATSVSAEDKKTDPNLIGGWSKNVGLVDITFHFVKDGELNVVVAHRDKKSITIQCSCKVVDGVVKAKVVSSKVVNDFDIGLKIDNKFTFQFKFKLDKEDLTTIELTEFNCKDGDNNVEDVNIIAAGTYTKVKIKK